MTALSLLGRLLPRARNRDGQAHALEPLAAEPPPAPPPGPAPAAAPQRLVLEATAEKLLVGWLANRSQTLVPHTLNFGALAPEQASLLIRVMAAAAQADGQVDSNERRQIPLALERVGAGEAEVRQLEAAIGEPQPLAQLLAEVRDVNLSAHAYAAALLAINRGGQVNQAFLEYLAARLALPPDVARSLESRYRA